MASKVVELPSRELVVRTVAMLMCCVSLFKRGYSVHTYICRRGDNSFYATRNPDEARKSGVLKITVTKRDELRECSCKSKLDRVFKKTGYFEVEIEGLGQYSIAVPHVRKILHAHIFIAPYSVKAELDLDQESKKRLSELGSKLLREEERRLRQEGFRALCYSVTENITSLESSDRDVYTIRPVCVCLDEIEEQLQDVLSYFESESLWRLIVYRRANSSVNRSTIHNIFRKYVKKGVVLQQLCRGAYLCKPESKCRELVIELGELGIELLTLPVVRLEDSEIDSKPIKRAVLAVRTGSSQEVKKRVQRVLSDLLEQLHRATEGVYLCSDSTCVEAYRKLKACGAEVWLLEIYEEQVTEKKRTRTVKPALPSLEALVETPPLPPFEYLRSLLLGVVRSVEEKETRVVDPTRGVSDEF